MPIRAQVEISTAVEFLRSPKVFLSLLKSGRGSLSYEEVQRVFPEKYGVAIESGIELLRGFRFNVFQVICFLARHFISYRGGSPKIRHDALELYHFITTSLDVNAILALSVCQELSYRIQREWQEVIERFIEREADFDSEFTEKLNEISDLHIHLGGALKFTYRLHYLLKNPIKLSFKRLPLDPVVDNLALVFKTEVEKALKSLIFLLSYLELLMFKSLKLGYLPKEYPPPILRLSPSRGINLLLELIKRKWEELLPSPRGKEGSNFSNCEGKLPPFQNWDSTNNLLKATEKLFSVGKVAQADRLLLLTFFLGWKRGLIKENWLAAYLVGRNLLKSIMVQQNRRADFLYFSSFSRSDLRRSKVEKEYDYIAQGLSFMFQNITKINIEARITPEKSAKSLQRKIKTIKTIVEKRAKNVEIKFVIHFIREKESSKGEPIRWKSLRKKVFRQTRAIEKLLKNEKGNLENIINCIDVASKEFYAPPEVFSKAYLYLKRKNLNLHFTYHAGEEFKEPCTGLRSIYEAITFLNLHKGDRIGHGLALGIDPEVGQRYLKRSCFLSIQEALDNSAFLYYLLSTVEREIPDRIKLREETRNLIETLIREVLEPKELLKGFSARDYIDSWLLRRNCPLALSQLLSLLSWENSREDPFAKLVKVLGDRKKKREILNRLSIHDKFELIASLPDIFYEEFKLPEVIPGIESARGNPKAWQLLFLYSTSEQWFKNGKRLYEREWQVDYGTIKIIQSELIELVKRRGITVEVLITSNLLITPLEGVKEHPVFKLLEKGVRVVLGSDNPGIQETGIAFEVELLYSELLKKHGEKRAGKLLKEILEEGRVTFRG